MTEIAVRNDRLVAAWIVVVNGILDQSAGIADMTLATHSRGLGRTAVRTEVARRAVDAVGNRSHVGSAIMSSVSDCFVFLIIFFTHFILSL